MIFQIYLRYKIFSKHPWNWDDKTIFGTFSHSQDWSCKGSVTTNVLWLSHNSHTNNMFKEPKNFHSFSWQEFVLLNCNIISGRSYPFNSLNVNHSFCAFEFLLNFTPVLSPIETMDNCFTRPTSWANFYENTRKCSPRIYCFW